MEELRDNVLGLTKESRECLAELKATSSGELGLGPALPRGVASLPGHRLPSHPLYQAARSMGLRMVDAVVLVFCVCFYFEKWCLSGDIVCVF